MNFVRRIVSDGSGEMPAGIADRETDRLGADIEAGELAAARQRVGKFADAIGDQCCQAASLRSASRRIAPQNKRIIVHVIIVSRQHKGAERRNLAVQHQQPLVAMCTDFGPATSVRRHQVGAGNQRSGSLPAGQHRSGSADRVHAEEVLAPRACSWNP